jgi:hypothetical protein
MNRSMASKLVDSVLYETPQIAEFTRKEFIELALECLDQADIYDKRLYEMIKQYLPEEESEVVSISSLRKIARRLATEDHTSYSIFVLEKITDDMRKAMDVPLDAEPYAPGANSAVFDNTNGNIVVFSDYTQFYNIAEKAQKRNSDALPKIFKVEKFELEGEEFTAYESSFMNESEYMYAVEMQKLNMLDKKEEAVVEKYRKQVFSPEFSESDAESLLKKAGDDSNIVRHLIDLKERAERDKISHNDIHAGNMAKDDEGNYKFIDLEAVSLGDVELAPQSKAASHGFYTT